MFGFQYDDVHFCHACGTEHNVFFNDRYTCVCTLCGIRVAELEPLILEHLYIFNKCKYMKKQFYESLQELLQMRKSKRDVSGQYFKLKNPNFARMDMK